MDEDARRAAALDELARLRAEVDARAAELAAHHAARLSCKRGCAGCCLDDLTVFEVEAEAIRRAHPELLAREAPHAAGACAFLDAAGACRIYEERPYLCRTHGLPLAIVEERGEDFVELRDVCPLNESGTPLEELAPDELWRIGPFEERLRAIQQRFSDGTLRRVPLRSLFARAHVLEPSLRRPLTEALGEIEAGSYWAGVLRELFRRESWLDAGARAALVGALATLLHLERRACAALERQLPRKTEAETVFTLHLASLLLTGRIDAARAARELPGVDWERMLARDRELCADPDPARALAQRAALPLFLARRLHEEFGDQARALALGLHETPRISLRANTLKGTREELRAKLLARAILARPGRFGPDALVLDGHHNVFEWPEFQAGEFEPQDEASQLAALLVAPPSRALVVDACAGSGGKTLALAALLGNRGRVLALDRSTRRLAELERRAARAGAFNVIVARTPGEGEALAPELARARGRAQRVLVDAPCSGLGALRRKPDLLRRLEARTLAELPHEQLAIAREARRWLAPGGRLVYATCTLLAAENERVVEALVADGMELVPAREVLGGTLADQVCSADGRFLKLLPHVHGTDGFFAAVLREPKASGTPPQPAG